MLNESSLCVIQFQHWFIPPLHPDQKPEELAFLVVLEVVSVRKSSFTSCPQRPVPSLAAVVTLPLGMLSHETGSEGLLGERRSATQFLPLRLLRTDCALHLVFILGH